MATFRIHLASGGKHDVDADTADQARQTAKDRWPEQIVTKIKRVREGE